MGTVDSPLYYHASRIMPDAGFCTAYEDVGKYIVCITTKEEWDKNQCQIDHTTPMMDKIIEDIGIDACEIEETTYIVDEEQLERIENDPRLYKHPGFDAFIKQCNGEE